MRREDVNYIKSLVKDQVYNLDNDYDKYIENLESVFYNYISDIDDAWEAVDEFTAEVEDFMETHGVIKPGGKREKILFHLIDDMLGNY